ncbi:hypothetical protein PHMEG_00024585 [Phytophthora megakarya]|uniref:Eukaryotic/viral aspartic protease n=1 Tax=Phytophthora megakarya TaxID=4795 RepID=A0A225VFU6_9STRA|nr:hypothetical protein PHMEG_00024585 [Phytophthora megakarya]
MRSPRSTIKASSSHRKRATPPHRRVHKSVVRGTVASWTVAVSNFCQATSPQWCACPDLLVTHSDFTEQRCKRQANAKSGRSSREPTPAVTPARSPEQMQIFFNAAMNRYLKEKQTGGSKSTAGRTGQNVQDVEMEYVESYHDSHDEYNPDNLSIDTPRQAVVASAEAVAGQTSTSSTMTPRIRVSAISELKEYSGKSAFVRNQVPDSEKCLILGDPLTGPARNWYRQLSQSTRGNWKSLLEAFQKQYCGSGVSVAR